MTKITDITQGIIRLIPIEANPADIIPVQSIPYEVEKHDNFSHVYADGEMEIEELLKACGYKNGYIMGGFPIHHNKKFLYEVRIGNLLLD